MSIPNPLYDPDWEARHDRHAAEREAAQAESLQLVEAGEMNSVAYQQADERWKRSQRECIAALKAQHRTVQDYAAWLLSFAPVDSEDLGEGIPIPVVSFDTMRTLEEVEAAWRRISDIVSTSAFEMRGRMATGQPHGVSAFADDRKSGLLRHCREFTARELYPEGYAPGGLQTLMVVDEDQNGVHICFSQIWNTPGPSVTNAIEVLATAIYRETVHIRRQHHSQPSSGLIGRLTQRLVGMKDPAPARFHFYEHLPPNSRARSHETFARVTMRFEKGRFRTPEWEHFEAIPAAIQDARFELARQVTMMPRQQLLP